MAILINKLKKYGPTNPRKVKSRQEVLDNANRLYAIRNEIINAFENKIFITKQIGTTNEQQGREGDKN